MQRNFVNFAKVILPLAGSLSLLTACGPSPTTPSPSPGVSVAPTLSPTSPPTTTPTDTPTTNPTVTPTGNPSTTPTTSPSATGNPSASPTSSASTPLASATSDISVVEKTTFNGKIFDDTQAPLDGVTVTAKSLNSSVPYDATNTTAGGSYAFNNAPSGVQIEISVSKPGYTTRRRVEVLKSNKDGDPNANKYDFGAGSGSLGTSANALSDKPEVTVVTPGRNSAGVSPTSSFVLKFSEGMDRATVVDNFEIRSFTSEKLSVDTSGAVATLVGTADINSIAGTRVWDKAAFNVSWNSDDTEATFTFKEERSLPTDKDTDKIPDYQVSLERQDKNIKDKSGISRSTENLVDGDGGRGAFKLTEGNFERSYKFSISADTTRPKLDSITAQTAENSGATSNGDSIKIRFNERMIHYTLGPTIAGGMGGVASQGAAANNALLAEAAASNYKVTVIRSGLTQLNQVTWSSLGGRAIFDTNDPTHKTVILLPATQNSLTGTAVARPPAGATTSPMYLLNDGTTVTAAPSVAFQSTTNAAGTLPLTVANGVTTITPATVDFFYTDGTREVAVATVNGTASMTAAQVQTLLNTLTTGNTGFTVSSSAGAGAIVATNTVVVGLTNGTQRNGKTVNVAVIQPTGIFATGQLNAPAGGYGLSTTGVATKYGWVFATGATTLGDSASVSFAYGDGTTELNALPGTALGANATDAQVETHLNSLLTGNTGFQVNRAGTSGSLGGGATSGYAISLLSGAQRNGKTVVGATLMPTGAFATNKLGNVGSPGGIFLLANEYGVVQYQLNNQLNPVAGGRFTVSETNNLSNLNTVGVINPGDSYSLSLGAAPQTSTGQEIRRITIPQEGMFAATALNAPLNGFVVFPNTSVTGSPDLYMPGDNVIIMVDTTVLDPAGNSVDSSGDDASANAS